MDNNAAEQCTDDNQWQQHEVLTRSGKDACNLCNAPANKSCSACQVKYCSAQHQREDWPTHKNDCCPFKLKTNQKFGRHFVAARRLKAGTLVIQEDPTLCAPRGLPDGSPICLSCCVLMESQGKSSYRCSKCAWPICSPECEQHELHAQNECKIFSERHIKYPPSECEYPTYIVYKVVEILRGVLIKENDPELWAKITNLQCVTELGNKTDLFQDLGKLRNTFGVEDIGLEEDWKRILGILNVNNFSMKGRRNGHGPWFTGYVFLQSSMLAHSCLPNCWWGVSMFPDHKIQVRTTVDVQKGDVLTVPYSYIYNAFGTSKRQELIQDDGEFICKCERCEDPTELNSFTSALICRKCRNGSVLPLHPLVIDSEWQCNICHKKYFWDDINNTIQELMTKLEQCETVTDMENFIKEAQGTVHLNHWLITEAEDAVCQQRMQTLYENDEVTLEERDVHISMCEHLLKVKNLTAPGFSLERGRLLNRLARARFERLDDIVKNNTVEDADEILAEAEFIYVLYDEALCFYKNDITEVLIGEHYGLKCRMIMSDMQLVKEKFAITTDTI
ncbi:SET domain-containing protein SmydA-8 [Folsomia candida]|uniref:SET domain-containing protein SmydA-8 n=1 Tax=Folsomia candida TaxID=158441 RepID=UPI000B8FC3ED|nr:SET domain-containing protein SmydA-8 [Folsomia candida]